YAAAEAAFIERWGSRAARRKGTLLGLVALLVGYKQFSLGARVAYPVGKLQRALRKNCRSVERAISELREFPEFIRVVKIERREIAWNNRSSFVAHLEWELGPQL